MEITIGVYGMTCGHCQKRIADAISSLEGVESTNVDLESERAIVSFDPQKVSLEDIIAAIHKAGYSTESEKEFQVDDQPAPSASIEPAGTVLESEISEAPKTSKTLGTAKITSGAPEEASQTCSLNDTCKLAEEDSQIPGQKPGMKEITLGVSGMTCSACTANIERVLKKK